MDIVLEIWDTFLADHVFAKVFPAQAKPFDIIDGVLSNHTIAQASLLWQYTPATEYWTLEPPEAAYLTSVPRDNIWRQLASLYTITVVFGFLLYFIFASLSYWLIFDKQTLKHPKFLKNQMSLEMKQAVTSMPGMAVLTAPMFLLEVKGYCKFYERTEDGPGRWYDYAQFPFFILFTDICIYWVHRGLHHPWVYKRLHKPHHKWIMPTPFASHAFHPVDGFAQSFPYHIFPLLFPLHKFAFLGLFIFVNIWSILIHDGEYLANNPIINGSACHTAHHLYFNYNYGQYTTIWDRLGGSYRKPDEAWFDKDTKMAKKTWEAGVKEMERIQHEVEGDDDRSYNLDGADKKTK